MPGKMTDIIRLTVSLPLEERDWLRNQAKANLTSINAELVRALRANRTSVEKRRARKGSDAGKVQG